MASTRLVMIGYSSRLPGSAAQTVTVLLLAMVRAAAGGAPWYVLAAAETAASAR